jgi:hypothetical protein
LSKSVGSFQKILLLAVVGFLALANAIAAAVEGAGDGWDGKQRSAPNPPLPLQDPSIITVQVRPKDVVLGETICVYGSLTNALQQGLPGRAIQISIAPPDGDPFLFSSQTNSSGDYVFFYTPPSAGNGWEATASWAGDTWFQGNTADPIASFNVLKADTEISLLSTSLAVLLTETVDVFGRLKPTTPMSSQYDVLGGQEVRLELVDPLGETQTPLFTTTNDTGAYAFAALSLPQVGVWKLEVRFDGSADLNPSASRDLRIQVKKSAGYAVLVAGRTEDNTGLDSSNRTADTVYRRLLQRGFGPESIFFLRFGTPDDNEIVVDGVPSRQAVEYAITTWAKEQMTEEAAPLFVVLVGPGRQWQFFVSGQKESVTPWMMNAWMTSLEQSLEGTPSEGQPITCVLGAPYSGSFIHWLSSEQSPRIILTSSDALELSAMGPEEDSTAPQGEFFVLELFDSLAKGLDCTRSFEAAAEATLLYTGNSDGNGLSSGLDYPDLGAHHPLLEDNGDGIGCFGFVSRRPGQDGFLSSQVFLGYGQSGLQAEILNVSQKQTIFPGEQPQLWAKVNNRSLVQSVWMIVKPPLFALGPPPGDTTVSRDAEGLRVPLFDLDGDGIYLPADYPDFTEPGTYRVLFFVKDAATGRLGEIQRGKVIVFDPGAPTPGEFSLKSPEDGATVGSQILLTWGESQKGGPEDQITYSIQIATDPLFEEIVFERNDVEGTSLLVGRAAGLFDRTTYYWRVKAENFFGRTLFARSSSMRSTDIGETLPGDTQYNPLTDTYTILGNGLQSFGTEDRLRFVHTSAKGSFEISAKVNSLDGTNGLAIAGIMIRQSLANDSPYAMMAVDSEGLLLSAFRGAPGSSASMQQYVTLPLPTYLKLVSLRSPDGDSTEITPYFSTDGVTWDSGETIDLTLPKEVLVGICVTSGNPLRLVRTVVDEFTISPLADGSPQPLAEPTSQESALSVDSPPMEQPLASEYGSFTTNLGGGLPGYNVLTVLVYNQNDPSQSPPGTTIEISPIVGTVNNWMYSGYVPVGTYSIDVSAPNFSPEHRSTEVTSDSPATEVFTLVPNAGSVSGTVSCTNTMATVRRASVQLEVKSGIYLGMTYDAVTAADGGFSLTALPAAVSYQITVSKTFFNPYQSALALAAGEDKDLGTISIGFTDVDGDDLPDAFEQIIVDFDPDDEIDDITDIGGSSDFDGDGQADEVEFLAGTDPTAATSFFRILGIVGNSSEAFTVTWTSVGGMYYSVYYGDAIGVWSLADTDIAATGTGQNSWTDDDASGTIPPPGGASIRFYRVEAY